MKNAKNHREESKKNIILKGTIRAVRGNVAYFYSEKGILEAEISTRLLNTAMTGDSVEIKTFGLSSQRKSKDGKPEGEVIKIIKRAKSFFVGTIEKTDKKITVIPDDRKMKIVVEIPIEKNNMLGAGINKFANLNNGDKVKARVTKWNQYPNNSLGEIINILGKKGENSAEMHSIAIDKGFEVDFPEKVTEEANKIFQTNKTVPQEEYSKRKDLRNTLTFTIDPKTAKDFDDAISFKKLDNGNFEIGVHIADVSHYVTEKSELDKEAYKRGCSVYLPDRTIPMLPFELSDNLCSLNEGEEKLAFSAIFEMDSKAKVHSKWFGKSIIKSAKRFTYESAQEVIDSGSVIASKNFSGKRSDLFCDLRSDLGERKIYDPSQIKNKFDGAGRKKEHFYELDTLNKLSKILRKEKWLKGAIDFEQEEVAFELDESGKPIRIYKKERLDTHKLVEEFMLLANKEVAEFVYKHEKKTGRLFPLPYRIHDLPDKDKIAELSIFVKALGHELIIGKNGSITGKDMQALFAQVEGKAEEALVKTAAIRSMAKAIYSVKNIGHFGLAFEYYAHFTSPIRRYPDLLVHRILNKILSGESVGEKNFAFYENASRHSTDQEIKASEAEREGRKYKQVEFMQDKVGKTFDGLITGVTEWGIYAEDTETKAEGMIKLSSLGDDYYILDPKKYAIVCEKTKRTFTLGQKIKIKLVSTNLDRKTMDYEIVV